jgi:hypothetical protein
MCARPICSTIGVRTPEGVKMIPRTVLLSLSAKAKTADVVVDPEYWLCHCEGFRVDGRDGRIGTVVHSAQESELLTLRAGLFRSRELTVRFADVEEIRPREQRLVLHTTPRFTRGLTPSAAT